MTKGGSVALRRAVEFLRAGGLVLTTPDGPKGPRRSVARGAAPYGPVGRPAGPFPDGSLAARPALAFRSWDKARLPLPFARACGCLSGR